jgi:hypothetical protein
MKNLPATLAPLLAVAFASSALAHAYPDVDAACETRQYVPAGEDLDAELPHSAFRLEVLLDSGRLPGNFIATIAKHSTASIELMLPTRACRWEMTNENCPAIAEIAQDAEQLNIPIGKDHAAPNGVRRV